MEICPPVAIKAQKWQFFHGLLVWPRVYSNSMSSHAMDELSDIKRADPLGHSWKIGTLVWQGSQILHLFHVITLKQELAFSPDFFLIIHFRVSQLSYF